MKNTVTVDEQGPHQNYESLELSSVLSYQVSDEKVQDLLGVFKLDLHSWIIQKQIRQVHKSLISR